MTHVQHAGAQESATTESRLETRGNLLLVRLSGPVTAADLGRVDEGGAGRQRLEFCQAAVIDVRRGVLVDCPRDGAAPPVSGLMARLPAAIVASAAEMPAYVDYCRLVAAQGHIRRVFTVLAAAVAWAEQYARMGPW